MAACLVVILVDWLSPVLVLEKKDLSLSQPGPQPLGHRASLSDCPPPLLPLPLRPHHYSREAPQKCH